MGNKNLTDALLKKQVSRKKFMELFLGMVETGEELIRLLRRCEPRLFNAIRVPADELIEQWYLHLRNIMFLAIGEKTKFQKKDFH